MKPSPLSLLLMSEHQPATAPSGGTTPPAADATESASPATTETPVADVATETPEERAIRFEGSDAPASTATGYTMLPGDTFNGILGTAGDADWIRVNWLPCS